ncbi:SPW repeat protein [Steroidobacter flavus]|uniref:SPW repeat protein n=1 Tax=Steroidobacter flavus TaxID=1842136 RepID=A0ABV8SMG0_9GAMM
MRQKRWQDWGNLILGLWLVISPWALGFADHQVAAPTAWIIGAVIAVFAGIAVYMPKLWEEGVNIVVGAALVASPWVLAFADHETAAMNAAIVGTLVVALCIWVMVRDTEFQKRRAQEKQAQRTS